MSAYATVVIICVLLVAAMIFLLRTRRIREKYAAIWILLTIAVILMGSFPRVAFWLSKLVGVRTPTNLLFALAIVVLLGVCIQLSTEVSSLEEETRTLAQEIALQRLEGGVVRDAASCPGPPASAGGSDPLAAEKQ